MKMVYRKALQKDIEQIIELRIQLLIEEGAYQQIDITDELKEYFYSELNNSLIIGVAEEDNKIISTSSVIFQKYPPSFGNSKGMRAYITNVYTQPQYRRKGINSKIMDLLVEEIKKRGISYIWLWATEQGIPMYKKYGFKDLTAFATMDYNIK